MIPTCSTSRSHIHHREKGLKNRSVDEKKQCMVWKRHWRKFSRCQISSARSEKKLYTRDDGGGVQLTLYVWRELGLEKIQLHTAVRVTACVQCVHFVRSTSRNWKKKHTNLVVVSSWSVETPWFGTWVIFRLQEIDSSFENRRRRSLRKESAKIQVFNRHHYRSWYVRYVVDIIWTLCAWYDDLWNELNDILIIFSELWVRHFRSCKTKKSETLYAISCIGECSSILYVRNHYGKSRIPCVESYRQILNDTHGESRFSADSDWTKFPRRACWRELWIFSILMRRSRTRLIR